jgi:hypothetical protein
MTVKEIRVELQHGDVLTRDPTHTHVTAMLDSQTLAAPALGMGLLTIAMSFMWMYTQPTGLKELFLTLSGQKHAAISVKHMDILAAPVDMSTKTTSAGSTVTSGATRGMGRRLQLVLVPPYSSVGKRTILSPQDLRS